MQKGLEMPMSDKTTINLSEIAQKAMEDIVSSGIIEEKIKSTLEDTISNIIKQQLNWNSSFANSFKEAIKEKLSVDFSKIDVPLYNAYLLKTAEELTDTFVKEHGVESFKDMLTAMLTRESKTEYTLSELIGEYIDYHADEHYGDGESITLIIKEGSYGGYFVYFDELSDKQAHECAIRIYVYKGEICSVKTGKFCCFGEELADADCFVRKLFHMQISRAVIKFDQGYDALYYNTEYRVED